MDCIIDFLREIGLRVSLAEIRGPTVLPGIRVSEGGPYRGPATVSNIPATCCMRRDIWP